MATLKENINQAIADFDSIKEAIENQGVEVPNGTPTSQYGSKIDEISDYMKQRCEGTITTYHIPSDISKIAQDAFAYTNLTSITIPTNIKRIEKEAFKYCPFTSITFVDDYDGTQDLSIDTYGFGYCEGKIKELTLPKRLRYLGHMAICSMRYLEILTIQTTNVDFGYDQIWWCNNLKEVHIPKGFERDLNISNYINIEKESLLEIINNYADCTGKNSCTLKIGTTNLAKLTEEEKAIATNKNIKLQ
jgi:hypothetical protein|nr:MAG TPA: leucine rich repeat protein [Caudoviricetes sp.]